jgi:hypothetical protein
MADAIAKSKKQRPIPPKLKVCLEAMLDGSAKTMADGAAIAGCSRQYVHKALEEHPHALQWYHARIAKKLGLSAAAAASKAIELLDSASDRVKFETSRFLLGLSGFRVANDPSVNINIVQRAGFLIDLREDISAPPPEIEKGAAGATLLDSPRVIEGKAVAVVDAKPAEPIQSEPIRGIGPGGTVAGAKSTAE